MCITEKALLRNLWIPFFYDLKTSAVFDITVGSLPVTTKEVLPIHLAHWV
jgi:hypothetical protein